MSVLNTILLVIGVMGSACSMKIEVSNNAKQYLKWPEYGSLILCVQEGGDFYSAVYVEFPGVVYKEIENIKTWHAVTNETSAVEITFNYIKPILVGGVLSKFKVGSVDENKFPGITKAKYVEGNYTFDSTKNVLVAVYFSKVDDATATLNVEVLGVETEGRYKVDKNVTIGSPVFVYDKTGSPTIRLYGGLTHINEDSEATLKVFGKDFPAAVNLSKSTSLSIELAAVMKARGQQN